MPGFKFNPKKSAYDRTNALWLAKAAELAYKPAGTARKTAKRWGFTNFEFFDKRGTQAFVAGNADMILVAFRGTEPTKVKDWMTDAKIRKNPAFGGRVHRGFLGGLRKVWGHGNSGMIGAIRKFRDDGQTIWITGHSLGAALATLAAAGCRAERLPVQGIYTYGSPRVGSKAFQKKFDKSFKKKTFRFVNNNDVVTRVPPRALKYKHVGTLRYIDHNHRIQKDIGLWKKFLDRIKGRIDDFLKPGTDGLKDHPIKKYLLAWKK